MNFREISLNFPMLILTNTLKAIYTENFKLVGQIFQEISFLKGVKMPFCKKRIES